MTELPKLTENSLKRPKVFLRRLIDPIARLAVKEYILNRGKRSELVALENVCRVFEGKSCADQ